MIVFISKRSSDRDEEKQRGSDCATCCPAINIRLEFRAHSTNEDKQDIQRQVRELKAAGAEQIYLEYEHGDSVVKEQLSSLLDEASAGDTILTLEVSRLARSTKQLCDIIERVKDKRLRLSIVGSINVDCSNGDLDPMTNAFIQMSGVFAELELRIIRERVRSGMRNAAAKALKSAGRRPRLTIFPLTSFVIILLTKKERST